MVQTSREMTYFMRSAKPPTSHLSTGQFQDCICRGVGGLNPPRKFLTPPAAIKKRKGGRLSMYLCISTVVDFNSQNFDPPNEI